MLTTLLLLLKPLPPLPPLRTHHVAVRVAVLRGPKVWHGLCGHGGVRGAVRAQAHGLDEVRCVRQVRVCKGGGGDGGACLQAEPPSSAPSSSSSLTRVVAAKVRLGVAVEERRGGDAEQVSEDAAGVRPGN